MCLKLPIPYLPWNMELQFDLGCWILGPEVLIPSVDKKWSLPYIPQEQAKN
jgi:hypothetical protein